MVHTTPDTGGRAKLNADRTRLNLGCYNFDIQENCTLTIETGGDVVVPPLTRILLPDQVAVRALGANSQQNYWLTSISIGEGV